MSGIMMMVIAIVVLGGAYIFYGRYLEKKWGIDPNAKTPAYEMEDGVDYVPADTNIVFGHQFASIAGAGPINGPIQAAIFGWLPVLLWILIGGVFFGAVQDFSAMYASVTKDVPSDPSLKLISEKQERNCSCCSAGCSVSWL